MGRVFPVVSDDSTRVSRWCALLGHVDCPNQFSIGSPLPPAWCRRGTTQLPRVARLAVSPTNTTLSRLPCFNGEFVFPYEVMLRLLLGATVSPGPPKHAPCFCEICLLMRLFEHGRSSGGFCVAKSTVIHLNFESIYLAYITAIL